MKYLFTALGLRHSSELSMSRSGLRWSDRLEDYRAEVLGLVKAQQVKLVVCPRGRKEALSQSFAARPRC